MERAEVCVIGAGAAGLSAAIFAAEGGARVVVLDGAARIGKKILISGGGRCNVTNEVVTADDFNTSTGSRNVIRNVLAGFDVAATRAWFVSLGVDLKAEPGGKLFPVDDRAATVLAALEQRCAALEVEIRAGCRVGGIESSDGSFVVRHQGGSLGASRVVVATGGRSLPRTGSDGSGWQMVRALGHSVTATHPALVPLVLRAGFHAELSGLSQPAELTTYADGKVADRRTGSLLWTHFGISGPVVLDASRHWLAARGAGRAVELKASLLPGESFEQVEEWLRAAAAERPRLSLGRCLGQRLPERAAICLARAAGADPATALGQITRQQRRAVTHALTALPLAVERDRGWDFAEVTAGGVPLDEIDYRTMESRPMPGLHLIGEMLDCDGRIGGFNFQWAWATGHLAGRAAARCCAA